MVLKTQHMTLHALQISFRIRCAANLANLNDKLQDRKTNNEHMCMREVSLKLPTLRLQHLFGSIFPVYEEN